MDTHCRVFSYRSTILNCQMDLDLINEPTFVLIRTTIIIREGRNYPYK